MAPSDTPAALAISFVVAASDAHVDEELDGGGVDALLGGGGLGVHGGSYAMGRAGMRVSAHSHWCERTLVGEGY